MKIYICFSILLSFMLFGCTDFLDKRDPTATSFVEFFNDEEDLRRVIYSSYLDVFSNPQSQHRMFYMDEGKSDNAYSRVEGYHSQLIGNGNFNSNTSAFSYYYETHMKHLGRLNTFIDAADVPYLEDETVRAKYKSILESLRIWHYYILTARWGDVPFLLEPADLSSARQPVTPKEEILDILFPLAEEIAKRLPADEYTTDKYMFNRYSLIALSMRYAMFNGRYELAAKLAKQVMDSNKYSLHPVYGDLFQYKACSNNKEFIVWLDKESSGNRASRGFRDLGPHFRTGAGQSYMVPLKALVDSYWTAQGRAIDKCPLHKKEEYELNPHLNRDPRYSMSIFGHGDIFYGEEINIFNEDSPMYYELTRASRSGYWFKKWVSESDAFKSNGDGNMEFGMLRYAEVLLTYAEAKIMQNDIDALAKSCINQVRRRAGLDMTVADVTLPAYYSYTQHQLMELIRNERRVEFAGEGRRYEDIIRWRIAEDVQNKPAMGHTREIDGELGSLKIEDRTFRPHNYLWPFHESSLRVEPGLVQNPGY